MNRRSVETSVRSKLFYIIGVVITLSLLSMMTIGGCHDDDNGDSRRGESEPNDTFAECNLVGLSTVQIRGTIDPQGDQDDFCFDIEEAGTMLDFEIDTSSSPLNPLLQLFGPEPDNDLLAEGNTFLNFTVTEPGRYHIVVSDADGQGGSDFTYDPLTITKIEPEPMTTPTPTPTASPSPTPTASPSPTPTPSPMAEIHDVSIGDNFFEPAELTIAPGDTVRWTNNGELNHTTTSDDGGGVGGTWDSASEFPLPTGMEPGDVFEFTFPEAGDFPYHCQFHGAPGGVGQSGTITVEE